MEMRRRRNHADADNAIDDARTKLIKAQGRSVDVESVADALREWRLAYDVRFLDGTENDLPQ
jgi:hypothetical protein